jgi:hypothetical protein
VDNLSGFASETAKVTGNNVADQAEGKRRTTCPPFLSSFMKLFLYPLGMIQMICCTSLGNWKSLPVLKVLGAVTFGLGTVCFAIGALSSEWIGTRPRRLL